MNILLISETKIDPSFPTAQFLINGFTTYRGDRNINGGDMLLYIREDIPSNLLHTDDIIEGFHIEISIRKKKWLLGCSYNPHKRFLSSHLKELGKNLDFNSKHDNFILLEDLNGELTNEAVSDFSQVYDCRNIIKKTPTCFKKPQIPSCIDLIITNKPRSCEMFMTIETELSNFHKLSLTVMKVFYKKQEPNIIKYRSYRNFDNEAFISNLRVAFSEIYNENEFLSFETFKNIVGHFLETHAPLKK